MGMAVKVDEDLPKAVTELLRMAGYDAVSVQEQGMSGWKDHALWQMVQAEGRFLITADKGFADVRAHPPGHHPGILLLRPDRESIPTIIELMKDLLAVCRLEDLGEAVTVATTRGLRIRRS